MIAMYSYVSLPDGSHLSHLEGFPASSGAHGLLSLSLLSASSGEVWDALEDAWMGGSGWAAFKWHPLISLPFSWGFGPQTILVGGLEHSLFFHILGRIIPTDYFCYRGVETTNQDTWFYWTVLYVQTRPLFHEASEKPLQNPLDVFATTVNSEVIRISIQIPIQYIYIPGNYFCPLMEAT